MKRTPENTRLIATSNEKLVKKQAFPFELYANEKGECYEVHCGACHKVEPIATHIKLGYYGVSGETIAKRYKGLAFEPQGERLLNNVDAARYLGVKVKTLDSYRCQERYSIPYLKSGAFIKYRQSDLDKFMKTHTYKADRKK